MLNLSGAEPLGNADTIPVLGSVSIGNEFADLGLAKRPGGFSREGPFDTAVVPHRRDGAQELGVADRSSQGFKRKVDHGHSTVTLLARFRGLSTSQPQRSAISYESS